MIEILNKLSTEGMFLNIIKTSHDKSTANIIFNSENLKAFPLRQAQNKGVQTGHFYLHKISAIKNGKTYQISNNHGHINGWISRNQIFGKVIEIL